MIISASRRTDIPAFFSKWFMNRIRAGYCCVRNPFNSHQNTRVSLAPNDVEMIAFLTRNPAPMIPYLKELDDRGYSYFFHITLTGYPKTIERYTPTKDISIRYISELAQIIGPNKIIWRYDPIVFSNITDFNYHIHNFSDLCAKLQGSTSRIIISIMDEYKCVINRFNTLKSQEIELFSNPQNDHLFKSTISTMAKIAKAANMTITSCAEPIDLSYCGIASGKCIDDSYIKEVFSLDVSHLKDKSQRPKCGCVVSKDIGVYDTCNHGCIYCYAIRKGADVNFNIKRHNPDSEFLLDIMNDI